MIHTYNPTSHEMEAEELVEVAKSEASLGNVSKTERKKEGRRKEDGWAEDVAQMVEYLPGKGSGFNPQ